MDEKLNDQLVSIIDDVDDMTIPTIREDGFPKAAQFEPNEGDPMELCYFRVEPKVIAILDYKKGFGHTELVEM